VKSLRVGFLAVLFGAIYLILPYREAKNCLGMECLGFLFSTVPVAVLSQPWSQAAEGFAASGAKSEGEIYRGKLLHRDYWPTYFVTLCGYFFNLFAGGALAHVGWLRFRNWRAMRASESD